MNLSFLQVFIDFVAENRIYNVVLTSITREEKCNFVPRARNSAMRSLNWISSVGQMNEKSHG